MSLVRPGKFQMKVTELSPEGGTHAVREFSTEITAPFYIMATPTTQELWRDIARIWNERLKSVHYPFEIPKPFLPLSPSRFQGMRRPVEQVSPLQVNQWISALNWLSEKDEPALYDLIEGHYKGAIYALPSEAQWAFVASQRGAYSGPYDESWSRENSGGQTQPVGQLAPIFIDGSPIWDLLGNVEEITGDRFASAYAPPDVDPFALRGFGGPDPRGAQTGGHIVLRGGSYFYPAERATPYFRAPMKLSDSYDGVGFRFIRLVDH